MTPNIVRKNGVMPIKTMMNETGAKLDTWIGAGMVTTGTMAPDSFLTSYGSNLMIAGGLLLLAIRIAIGLKSLFKG